MGNLGKATSFVDPEGDGDVMPKLVDMLTKVKEFMFFYASSMCCLKPKRSSIVVELLTSMIQVGVEVPEFLGEGGSGGDAGGDDDEDWGQKNCSVRSRQLS